MCALAFPLSANADTITVGWNPHPDATVVGYMLYVEGPSGYSRSFDVGLSVVFPFTEAVAGQQYCFTVASYAGGPRVGPPSSPVCGYSNMAPVFAGVSDRSTGVGQAVSLQLDADDPEGRPLTYTATGLPPGLTLQSSTGFISGTPTTVGTYNVTATARDESLSSVQTFTWSIVAPGGTAPSTSAPTGGALTLTSLTADRPAPQPAGSSITFTATVAGGVGPHQFKWWVHAGNGWYIARDWAQGNTWTWTPTVANSGYRVSVWVRNATTTADTYENNQSTGSHRFPNWRYVAGPAAGDIAVDAFGWSADPDVSRRGSAGPADSRVIDHVHRDRQRRRQPISIQVVDLRRRELDHHAAVGDEQSVDVDTQRGQLGVSSRRLGAQRRQQC